MSKDSLTLKNVKYLDVEGEGSGLSLKVYLTLALILGVIVSMLLSHGVVADPDSFWHIKTGQWILENKKIPQLDPFSWYSLEHNLKWVNHEWAFAIIIYLIYSIGQLKAVAYFVSMIAGILFLLLYKYIDIRTKNKIMSIVLAFVGILGLYKQMQPRPQIISYCILLTIAILLEKEKWWYVIPLVVLGVNIHGGFYPIYIIVIAYYSYRKKPFLILAALLSVIINPYGIEMVLYPINIQKFAEFHTYIMEWHYTPYGSPFFREQFVGMFIVLLLLSRKKLQLEETLFSLAFFALSFTAARHVVFLSLLILPILSRSITEVVGDIVYMIKNKEIYIGKKSFSLYMSKRVFCIFMIGWLAVTAGALFSIVRINVKGNVEYYDKDTYPSMKMISYIKENHYDNRLLNIYDNGGFLIFNDIKPAIDGRADIFVPYYNNLNFYLEYVKTVYIERDTTKIFDDNNIKYFLCKTDLPLYRAIVHDKEFTEVYRDGKFLLLEYTKDPNKIVIEDENN